MFSILRYGLAVSLLAAPLRPVAAAVVSDPPIPEAATDVGATSPLVALAYSPDGNSIWSLGSSGELLQREVKSGAIRFQGQISGEANRLIALDDGSLLVSSPSGLATHFAKPVAGQPLLPRVAFNEAEVKTQKQTTRPPLFELKLGDMALSPDEKWLAIETLETAVLPASEARPALARQPGAKTARIRIWNLEDGTLARELEPLSAAAGAPRVVWGEAPLLTVVWPDLSLQRFDVESGELKSEWKPTAADAAMLDAAAETAAPDEAEIERRLNLLPERMRERARARLTRPRAPRTRPADAGRPVPSAIQAISRDARLILVAEAGGLRLWDTRDGSQRVLEGSERFRIRSLSNAQFSADGALIALREGSTFWVWKSDGARIGEARIPFDKFSALTFSRDASALALSDDAGVAREWKIGAPLSKTAQTTLPGYFQAWTNLETLPDGLLAATERGVASLKGTEPVRWFENTPLEATGELSPTLKTSTFQQIIALRAAPDGKSWAESVGWSTYSGTMSNAGIPRGELRGRDAQTGANLWRINDSNGIETVDLLRFLPDGTLLTGKNVPGRSLTPQNDDLAGLQARDSQTGQQKPFDIAWGNTLGTSEPGRIQVLEPSADGKRLVVGGGGSDGLQILDLTQKTVIGFFGSNIALDRSAWASSAEGKWLAGATRGGIGLWDITGARKSTSVAPDVLLKTESGQKITALKFSANGELATGFSDGRVFFYKPEFRAASTPAWETSVGRAITSLSFSATGDTLWSGDERGDLKARNAATGALKSTLRLLAPPTEAAQGGAKGAASAWIKWDRAGKVESSTP